MEIEKINSYSQKEYVNIEKVEVDAITSVVQSHNLRHEISIGRNGIDINIYGITYNNYIVFSINKIVDDYYILRTKLYKSNGSYETSMYKIDQNSALLKLLNDIMSKLLNNDFFQKIENDISRATSIIDNTSIDY